MAHKSLVYHYDHLGSIQAITKWGENSSLASSLFASDESGKRSLYSYDPWGQRRDPKDWKGPLKTQSAAAPVCTWAWDDPTTTTDEDDLIPRGFTGHEMVDALGLIHMNGRIYDPLTGRFLSADQVIQSPFNLQSYNRYSYCMNNPTGYVDPSGYEVFAAARDLDGVPVGTHQFTIVVPDEPNDFANLVDLGSGRQGFVLGAHNVNGRLTYIRNQHADLQAAREWADPGTNVKWYKADFDTETRLVNTPEGQTDSEFILNLVTNASNYASNESMPDKHIPYPDTSTNTVGGAVNSNSWNQSLIESAGGEVDDNFTGLDTAHNLRIDASYFQTPQGDNKDSSEAENSLPQQGCATDQNSQQEKERRDQ